MPYYSLLDLEWETDFAFIYSTLALQHRWTFHQDWSYSLCYRQSVDLGGYSPPIFQRRLGVWCFWTLLVSKRKKIAF
jgi:hypothetical protein